MALSKQEQLDAIERYYQRQIAGATSDEEELAIAQALLEAAQRGHVVNDAGTDTIIVRSPDVPPNADFLLDQEALDKQDLRRALPIVGALIVALIVILFAYGGWGGNQGATPTVAGPIQVTLATRTITPTPSTTPTPTPMPTQRPTPTSLPTQTPTPLPPEEIEVKPEPVNLDADAVIPVSLEIAGHYYPIVPTGLWEDHWAYVTDPGQASWLAGSYVNVILGLPCLTAGTPDNWDLVANTLATSDTLAIRNSVAVVNRYTVVDRRSVSIYEIEAFRQRQAGLTLVLLGGNDEGSNEGPDRRLIVWAVPCGTHAVPCGTHAMPAATDREEVSATRDD